MARKRIIKSKDSGKPRKKKISFLNLDRVDFVDYKDVNLLRKFMSDRAKIRARRVTGNDSQQQKEVSRAIKNAREMALLPYANRVTTQKGGGRGRPRRDRDDDREDRGDRPDRGDRGDRPDRGGRSARSTGEADPFAAAAGIDPGTGEAGAETPAEVEA